MTRLDRIIWIDSQIQAGKYPNVQSVCEHFQVCRRIVFGDRRFMIDKLNVPLAYSRQNKGWCYTKSDYSLWKLTEAEKTLLSVLKSEIEFLRGRIENLEAENKELRRALLAK